MDKHVKNEKRKQIARVMGLLLFVSGLNWVRLNLGSADVTLWLGLLSMAMGFLGMAAFRFRGVKELVLFSFTLSVLWFAGEGAIRFFAANHMSHGFISEYQWVEDSELKYTFRPGVVTGDNRTINKLGLLDSEFSLDKPEGVFRIAVIGDSLTADLQMEATYPDHLKKLFTECGVPARYEVMNFGVTGYNTLQEAQMTGNVAMKFHPDLIILGYVLNDPYPYLAINPVVSVGNSKFLSFLWQRTGLFGFKEYRNESFEDLILRLHTDRKSWHDVVQRGFGKIASAAKNENIPTVVVIFPLFTSFDSPRLERVYQIVESEGRSHGFDVISLLPAFNDYKAEDIRMPGDMFHCKAEGHLLAARTIFCSLRRYWPECLNSCDIEETASRPQP